MIGRGILYFVIKRHTIINRTPKMPLVQSRRICMWSKVASLLPSDNTLCDRAYALHCVRTNAGHFALLFVPGPYYASADIEHFTHVLPWVSTLTHSCPGDSLRSCQRWALRLASRAKEKASLRSCLGNSLRSRQNYICTCYDNFK